MAAPVLYLIIQLGGDRYALEASQVMEVVPLVRLKTLHGAPPGAAGLMNFRGTPLPVVDLSLMATGASAIPSEATRIVVVRYAAGEHPADGDALGLLVPEARETMCLDADSFADAGMVAEGAPYLGQVLATTEGVVQRVTVAALLTAELRDALFRRGEAA
jgi:chemotaxis-related protein WspB